MKEKFELNVNWADLKVVIDRIAEINTTTEAIADRCSAERRSHTDEERILCNNLWRERWELDKKFDYMRRRVIPEVGIPCTVHYYSDSSAGYIKEVPSPKTIVVQQDGVYHGIKVFTYRSNGHWVEKGTTSRDWGTLCGLGYQHNYYDRSF